MEKKDYELIKKEDGLRFGCNVCKKNKSTEAFVGTLGTVLWICSNCKKLLKEKPLNQKAID